MRRPRLLLFASLTLATLLGVTLAGSRAAASPAAPSPGSQYGIDWIGSAEMEPRSERFQVGAASGAGWDRWVFYWSTIEQAPGQFNWAAQDRAFLAEASSGLSINAVLLTTPDMYASGGLLGKPVPDVRDKRPLFAVKAAFDKGERPGDKVQCTGAANTYPPRSLSEAVFITQNGQTIVNPANHWARFVYTAVQRYKPGGALAQAHGLGSQAGVRAWEIWNEPDWDCGHTGGGFGGFFNGTPDQYYQMLKIAYRVVKFADPSAVVITGGLTYWANPGWFDEFAAAVKADPDKSTQAANNFYFDAFSLHWYSNVRHALERSDEFSWRLQQNGFGSKPIWLTETGLPINGDDVGPGPNAAYTGTSDDQASYIIQNAAYAQWTRSSAPSGVDRLFHFQLYDDGIDGALGVFGLVRNPAGPGQHPTQPGVTRPGYAAFQVVTRYLEGATPLSRSANDQVEQLAFRRSDGSRVTVVWNWTGASRSVQVTAAASSAIRVDRSGAETVIFPSGGRYSLSLPPATNYNQIGDPRPMIGGAPFLLIEGGSVPPPTATATRTAIPPTATPSGPSPTPSPSPTPLANGCLNLTANAGFETEGGWVFERSLLSTFQAYSGARSAFIGLTGAPQNQTWSTARQTVRLPMSVAHLQLQYARLLSGGEAAHQQVVEIWVGDSIIATLEHLNPAATEAWTVKTWDVTGLLLPYLGQDIRLSFATRNDPGAARAAYMRLDEVLLMSCPAPPTPTAAPTRTPTPTPAATPTTRAIRGRVLDSAGWPLADALVSVNGPAGFSAQATSDASGRFEIPGAPTTGLTMTASLAGFGAWPARSHVDSAVPVELRLPPNPNAIRNGGFDPLMAPIADWAPSGDTPVVGAPGLSGFGVVLGQDYEPMAGGGSNSTLRQLVRIPDADGVGLGFAYRLDTDESAAGQDFFEVLIFNGDARVDVIERAWHPSAGWGYRWVDLTAWRGQTVDLVFNVYQSSREQPTLFYLDEVSVGVGRAMLLPYRQWFPDAQQTGR